MSGGGTNTVSQTTIPSAILPYYQQALQQGQQLESGPGPQYYPGNQVAPLNPLQEQGLSSVQNTANAPNATQGAQQANMFETSGALLNPASNPYLQNTFNLGAQQVQNNLSSQFGAAGRNVLASAPVQSDEMNNLATQLYGGQYDTGLKTMLQAQQQAPSIDAGMYTPSQALLSAGSGLQGQSQNLINQNVNAYNYNQQLPYNQLSWYSGLLGQNASPFRSGSSNTSGQGNPWSTAIGAGLLGTQAYGALGGGAAAGAGAGLSAADAAGLAAASDAGYAAFASDAALAAAAA